MTVAMKPERSIEVLICGGGAAGLTLAIDLARRGVAFRIVEKMATPFAGSRGKAVQPRTLEILEDLGIVDRVAAKGGHYPRQREYRDDGSVVDSAVMVHGAATPAEPYPAPLMVAQFLTEGVLRDRLAELGGRVEFGCELIGFADDGDGVRARLIGQQGEETARARTLIGADGGRSFVRSSLDVGFPGKTLGARGIVADTSLTGLAPDFWHRFGKGPDQLSLCPLVGTEMFQLQGTVPLDGDIDLSAEGLTALIRDRTGRDDIRIDAVFWASAYHMNARLADQYRVGRVFLVGDAAHIHPPTGGQGLNTSIQDAYNLGWKLAAVLRGAPDALLDTYEAERRPIAADMLGLATKLLGELKAGEIKRGREVQQLDLGYFGSSLAVEHPERGDGIRAGSRAPDAPMRGAGGQAIRLFDLLKGPHWTLLGYEADRTLAAPRPGLAIHIIGGRGDVRDPDGHFRTAYGVASGSWVLVRPDGYVGAVIASDAIATLAAYLDGVGTRMLTFG